MQLFYKSWNIFTQSSTKAMPSYNSSFPAMVMKSKNREENALLSWLKQNY